jgi:hypothetical protein
MEIFSAYNDDLQVHRPNGKVPAFLLAAGIIAAVALTQCSDNNEKERAVQKTLACNASLPVYVLDWEPGVTIADFDNSFIFESDDTSETPAQELTSQGGILIIKSDQEIKLQTIFPPDEYPYISDDTMIATAFLGKNNNLIYVGPENKMPPYTNFAILLDTQDTCVSTDPDVSANMLIAAIKEEFGLNNLPDNFILKQYESNQVIK